MNYFDGLLKVYKLPKQGEERENDPPGGGIFWVGKTVAEDAALSFFLPVHLFLLLFPSLQERGLIFGKVLEEKDGGQGTGIRKRRRSEVRGLPGPKIRTGETRRFLYY
ncbi:MAG: hypothetical protein WAN35_21730 [Terracidiphilus sp.]